MAKCQKCQGTGKIKVSEKEIATQKSICEKLGITKFNYEWKSCECNSKKNEKLISLKKDFAIYNDIAENCCVPKEKHKFCFDMYKLELDNQIQDFLTKGHVMNEHGKKMTGFVFWSKRPGSGKTLLALSMAHSLAVEKKKKFIYENTTFLWAKLRNIFNMNRKDNYYHELPYLEKLSRIPVLVMDDLGTEKPSDWMREKLYYIVESRNSDDDRIDIYTSNDSPQTLVEKVGDKIVSRLMEFNIWIEFSNEKDWRMEKIA